jgi:hypothetical protein
VGHDYGLLQFAWAIRYEGLTGFEETPIEHIEIGMGDIGYTFDEDPIGKTGFWYVKLRIKVAHKVACYWFLDKTQSLYRNKLRGLQLGLMRLFYPGQSHPMHVGAP